MANSGELPGRELQLAEQDRIASLPLLASWTIIVTPASASLASLFGSFHLREGLQCRFSDSRISRSLDECALRRHVGGIQPMPPPGRPGDLTGSTSRLSRASVLVRNARCASSTLSSGCSFGPCFVISIGPSRRIASAHSAIRSAAAHACASIVSPELSRISYSVTTASHRERPASPSDGGGDLEVNGVGSTTVNLPFLIAMCLSREWFAQFPGRKGGSGAVRGSPYIFSLPRHGEKDA
jgi:hypothetical protein